MGNPMGTESSPEGSRRSDVFLNLGKPLGWINLGPSSMIFRSDMNGRR